jgi:hypothetical protein
MSLKRKAQLEEVEEVAEEERELALLSFVVAA